MKKYLKGILTFMRKYGIDAVISLIMWSSPSWLSIWIPGLRPFAVTWLALMVSPILPMWVVVPLFAVIIHWLRKQFVKTVHAIMDLLNKLKKAQELLLYYDLDEFDIILKKGKKMYDTKQTSLRIYKEKQKSNRLKLIKDKWEEES